MHHNDIINHCFASVRPILIVLAQTPVLPKPAECLLHDLSFWQADEAFDMIGTLDDLQTDLPIAAQQRHSGVSLRSVK
jgi:hypothetical protein